MHTSYHDITSRIPDPPLWWDEHAVPRYVPFHPQEVTDIYADEAALVRITCQGCGIPFDVAFSSSRMSRIRSSGKDFEFGPTLLQRIKDKSLHYGDPPNADCCAAGPTMNSEPRMVIEYWSRNSFNWGRNPAYEVDIQPPWVVEMINEDG